MKKLCTSFCLPLWTNIIPSYTERDLLQKQADIDKQKEMQISNQRHVFLSGISESVKTGCHLGKL